MFGQGTRSLDFQVYEVPTGKTSRVSGSVSGGGCDLRKRGLDYEKRLRVIVTFGS